ncbi:sporulation protein YqfC [Candidatus Arthromitus sp. SFB-rat-Yit]|uniref:sporulation protein YqfC n=1 Tax=Candidatus Arthromitus sp. SFB-rat-Yit TaxID=1041504 RepID=UPI000227A54C|nr:sporulation protein YqfC [Candidatus Arthromitus sp. SFB-rat-Yit]BAK80992.1 sporulation protein YqfC [Candidatus Arthromitus sp. SFB-rat-Yit]
MGKFIDDIKDVMVNKLDIPREIVKNSYKVIIDGDEFITIENHKGILKFQSDEIILRVDGGNFIIKGSKFVIVYISGKTIKLMGNIRGVNYDQL